MTEDQRTNKKRQPILHVDFFKTPAENIQGIYPLSDASMANSLPDGWTAEDVRRVNTQHGLYTDIPVMCKGKPVDGADPDEDANCPYAVHCPIHEDIVNARFVGKACPVEVLEAFKLFAGYVIDLDMLPDDFTDLRMVTDLVRLHMQERRCDLYQKNKPIWDDDVAAVSDKTGDVFYNRKANLGFAMQLRIRKDVIALYKELIASRRDKLLARTKTGGSDFASMMAKYKSNLEKPLIKQLETCGVLPANYGDVTDAEFEVTGEAGVSDDEGTPETQE